MTLNIKKIAALIIIGILFAIIGWVYPLNTGTIWIVNNTNLAPDAGVPHPPGTGERISGVTYWANNSPIQIFVYAHASTVADTAEIHLSINGTIVADTSGRPIGGAESSNKTIIATIPQYANYSVEVLNFHHYEWREYPILTGEITTNITTSTGTGAGCTGNCSFDGVWMNSIRKNNTADSYGAYINLSAPFGQYGIADSNIFTHFTMHTGDYYTLQSTNTTSGNYSIITGTSEGLTIAVTDTFSNNWLMYPDHTKYLIDTKEYILNQSELNIGNANIRDVNETNRVLRLNETRRNLTMNKIDAYKYPSNGTEIDIGTADTSFDTLLVSANKNTAYNLISFVNVNTTGWNYFAARAANGRYYDNNNTAYPENLTNGKVMLRFSAAGWFGDTWSGSTGIIDITADGNWNKTSTPTRIDIFTTDVSGGVTKRLSILKNGTINVPAFAGSGNGYVCYDNSGNWYRGTPGC